MAPSPTVTSDEFVAKWAPNAGRERSSSQEHFIDLCHMLGVPTPNDADPTAKDEYAFEKGASKTGGGDGWADVWKRGYFGWEYKGKKHPNLPAAYKQLLDYREDLENPPVLVVCDMDLIEVHTNFTNTAPQILEVRLSDLTDNTEEALRILRSVMSDPEALRPGQTPEEITEAAASQFAVIARSMQDREHAPEDVAHFLNRVLFCLFAEDVGLLPERIVTELIEGRWRDPVRFAEGLSELFRHMSYGGHFGVHEIAWFNGGLFTGDEVLEFTREELGTVAEASGLDWSARGAGDPRHTVRARARPREARTARRSLHRPREDPDGRRTSRHAAPAPRVRRDAAGHRDTGRRPVASATHTRRATASQPPEVGA